MNTSKVSLRIVFLRVRVHGRVRVGAGVQGGMAGGVHGGAGGAQPRVEGGAHVPRAHHAATAREPAGVAPATATAAAAEAGVVAPVSGWRGVERGGVGGRGVDGGGQERVTRCGVGLDETHRVQSSPRTLAGREKNTTVTIDSWRI